VRVPGKIDFYGSTLVGIPVLRAGFNDRLGFVTTNNAPDLDDVFALALDPDRADHYLFDGRSRPLTPRHVNVLVKNDDGSFRTETRTTGRSTSDRSADARRTRRQVHGLDAFANFEGSTSRARRVPRRVMAATRTSR
jgi:acyl-homoserine lactone acylase PvdQ